MEKMKSGDNTMANFSTRMLAPLNVASTLPAAVRPGSSTNTRSRNNLNTKLLQPVNKRTFDNNREELGRQKLKKMAELLIENEKRQEAREKEAFDKQQALAKEQEIIPPLSSSGPITPSDSPPPSLPASPIPSMVSPNNTKFIGPKRFFGPKTYEHNEAAKVTNRLAEFNKQFSPSKNMTQYYQNYYGSKAYKNNKTVRQAKKQNFLNSKAIANRFQQNRNFSETNMMRRLDAENTSYTLNRPAAAAAERAKNQKRADQLAANQLAAENQKRAAANQLETNKESCLDKITDVKDAMPVLFMDHPNKGHIFIIQRRTNRRRFGKDEMEYFNGPTPDAALRKMQRCYDLNSQRNKANYNNATKKAKKNAALAKLERLRQQAVALQTENISNKYLAALAVAVNTNVINQQGYNIRAQEFYKEQKRTTTRNNAKERSKAAIKEIKGNRGEKTFGFEKMREYLPGSNTKTKLAEQRIILAEQRQNLELKKRQNNARRSAARAQDKVAISTRKQVNKNYKKTNTYKREHQRIKGKCGYKSSIFGNSYSVDNKDCKDLYDKAGIKFKPK